jgi:Ca2+-binding RTX toxin-like protein
MATKNIGFVTDLEGVAQIRSVDGVIRVLSIGDAVHDGDVLTTAPGAEILLEFFNGNKLNLGESTEVLLDETVITGLDTYPDDQVDQLLQLEGLVADGVDVEDPELTAADASRDNADGLHQASIYTRDGNQGVVETRGSPLDFALTDFTVRGPLGEDPFMLANSSTGESSLAPEMPSVPVSGTWVIVDPIAGNGIVDIAEAAGPIIVTGRVGNDFGTGDSISFTVSGTLYMTTVAADNSFSVSVMGADLAADTSFAVTADGFDSNGASLTATTTSTHTYDSSPINNAPVAVVDSASVAEDGSVDVDVVANDTDVDGTIDPTTVTITAGPTNGSVSVDAVTGVVTYTPNPNYNGPDSFTYTVADDDGQVSSPAAVTLTVTSVNDAPVAIDDAITAIIDTPFTSTVDLDFNDIDIDGDALSVVAGTFATAQGGSIVIVADGSYTYTPPSGFNGTDTVDYTVTDGSLTDVGTLSINVSAFNNAPDAIDDAGALDGIEDSTTGSLNATMLSNDSDLEGDTINIIEINGTALVGGVQSIAVTNGTVNIDAGGNITFSADPNYNGPVSFNYTISDGSLTDNATVNGTISAVNDAPTIDTAINDAPTIDTATGSTQVENVALEGDTVATFTASDLEGDGITYSITSGNGFGYFEILDNTTGVVTDTLSDTNYLLGVTATDGIDSSTEATATISFDGINDAPTVIDVLDTAMEDGTVAAGTVAVTDPDGDTLTYALTGATPAGLTFNPDGSYSFDPTDPAYNGLAAGATQVITVEFEVNGDSDGPYTADLTITLTGTNDAPLVDLDADDSAAPGNDYAVTFTEGGSAVYIADADISITDADDSNIVSATISIAGLESGDLLTVGAIPAGITASAYDPVSGTIILSGSAPLADYQAAIRAVQFSNDGSTAGLSRSIDVVVSDGVNSSDVASTDVTLVTLPTISITDVSVQEPSAGTTTMVFTISIDQILGSNLTFDYATTDISALAGTDYVQLSSTVATITAGATSTTVTVTVNSDANPFEGDETLALNLTNFNQTVNFEAGAHTIGGGVQGIGTIGANNGPPVAVDDSYITTADTPLTITNALANDTLVDNAVVDVSGYTDDGGGMYSFAGTNGNVVYDANSGEFTFTPTGGYSGPASFSYTLIDDDGETDTANVSIDVSAVAVNPPVVTAVPDTLYVENDAPIALLTGVSIADIDSSSLSSVIVTVNGYLGSQDVLSYLTAGTSVSASVSVTGSTWELTLSGGVDIGEYATVLDSITYQNGSDNPSTSVRDITVEAYDESYANLFGSDAGTLSITAVNDAPDVFDNNVFTLESTQDNALNITLPTDVDNDDASLVITVTGLPSAIGVVTLNGSAILVGQVLTLAELNSLEFDAGLTAGDGNFTYSVDDGQLTSVGTTAISVGSTNADTGTVYEGGLEGGTGSGSAQVSGNLFANDPSAGSSIDSIDFGLVNEVPVAGVITVDTPLGELIVYADNSTPGFSAGDYVYTLDTSDLSGVDASEAFIYNFTNGGSFNDTLTISIIDDEPIATDLVQDVPESEENIFNIVFTLDDSGSMAWGAETGNDPPGAGESSRMDIAKDALEALGSEYFNQSTQVEITLITFNSTASFVGTYDNYADFETALNNVTPGGGTNYIDATDEIETQLTTDVGLQDPADNVQNISYFITDGANGGATPIGSGYFEFVNDNSIDSYAVGIGSSLPGDLSDLNYIHNIDSLGRGDGFVDEALIVADVSELASELLSTVPTAFGGSITASGSVSNVVFGGDGGYVQSMTVNIGGNPYEITYDGSTVVVPSPLDLTVVVIGSTIELNADDGFVYGTFTFDFSDGSYTLSAPNGVAPTDFVFDYSIIDNDGDIATATATLSIVDDSPDARNDLHTVEAYEVAAGNVITAQGSDGGPKFATSISPFASQGGGVDKVVDNATVSEFTYKESTISLSSDDFTVVNQPPPGGGYENVEVSSQIAIDNSNFEIFGFDDGNPNPVGIDFSNKGVGVGNNKLDQDESLLIVFDQGALPYGVENLSLEMEDYKGKDDDAVEVTLYALDGVTEIVSFTHTADVDGTIIDLSAYSGIGSVRIAHSDGNNSKLLNIEYDPVPGSGVSIDPANGSDGSDLSWIYGYETDLDGNDVIQATVTDASDGSVFIMRSNGFYEYTPDSSGLVLTPEAVTLTSAANLVASDLTITGFDDTGALEDLFYSVDGLGVVGGWASDRIDQSESVSIDFTAKGGNPNGVRNVQFTLTSAGANEVVTYLIYGLDGTTLLGTESSSDTPFTIDSATYPSIGRIDFVAGTNSTIVRILNISYDEITSMPPVNQDAILIDYVLTDSDDQSDTAQLAIYTIDQTLTGTTGVDNIAGGSLNDAIIGDAGNDILSGNAGDDSISGGADDDILSGGDGNDYLSGGDGMDSLSGGAGSDTLDGNAGDDVVDGGTGDDIVLGGDGDDLIFGGSGADRLEGGAGDDVLNAGTGDDELFGDAGDDILIGGSGDDSLLGGAGIDIFALESGDEGGVGTPAIDTIGDFAVGTNGDVLDLSDMLQGEDLGSLSDYFSFNFNSGTGATTISIDVDGNSGVFETSQQIVLTDVDLTAGGTLTNQDILDNLLNSGNLIVDQ